MDWTYAVFKYLEMGWKEFFFPVLVTLFYIPQVSGKYSSYIYQVIFGTSKGRTLFAGQPSQVFWIFTVINNSIITNYSDYRLTENIAFVADVLQHVSTTRKGRADSTEW